MKKVIGLFLVILISSATVFAQSGNRQGKKGDPSQRSEKMIEELKLDDKQAAEFRKVEADFREQMNKEREAVKDDREKMREKMTTMRTEKEAQIKKILTDEQYKLYQEKQKKADEAFDDIRRRFGNGMIVRGSTMSTAGKVARKAKAQMDQDVRTKKEKEK